jgi:hypothetical protein
MYYKGTSTHVYTSTHKTQRDLFVVQNISLVVITHTLFTTKLNFVVQKQGREKLFQSRQEAAQETRD